MIKLLTPWAVPTSDTSPLSMTGIVSRRRFLQSTSLTCLACFFSAIAGIPCRATAAGHQIKSKLQEFAYGDVQFQPCAHEAQFASTIQTLLAISDDDMLKPFRVRAGLSAPGKGLGGWYDENPQYDPKQAGDSVGFAPGHCFGQWLSALSRAYAINGSQPVLAKLKRLLAGYGQTITPAFYEDFRFPSYTYDKLVCGLLDASLFAGLPEARSLLERTTDAALPNLPPRALNRGEAIPAHPDRDDSFRWDESYTLPENLFRAYEAGAGERYRELAIRFLLDKGFFDELAAGRNALTGRHAYSFMNSLSSAMRAYLVTGSEKHLKAASNAFDMIQAQSFSTGGWGPDETFVQPGAGTLGKGIADNGGTHQSFETCGGYAHMKLTRYLLRATGNAAYGDSMEQVILNTVLGVKPMLADGSAFYYSDYNDTARKVYYRMKCPCCAGTLPQIVADYRICTYFHDAEGPLVNLYIPSTLKWKQDGAQFSLTQMTQYPFEDQVSFQLIGEQPREFSLRLRIPSWAKGATLTVNEKAVNTVVQTGTFASIHRKWTSGDRVWLHLPMQTRLQAVDEQHADKVALSFGPLALFALHGEQEKEQEKEQQERRPEQRLEEGYAKVTREQLLAAKKHPQRKDEWIVIADGGTIRMVPFTTIKDEYYSAYLTVSD